MSKALLDTDTLSEILKGFDPLVLRRATDYVAKHEFFSFTSVTAYEILTGLEKNQMTAKLIRTREVFALNEEIVPEREDYELAAKILGTLRRVGREVGYSDPLIADCALRRQLILATGNQKHFQFIQDEGFPLKLENWREP